MPTPNLAASDETENFSAALIDHIPALRAYGQALTRNVTEADDLVQDCLLKAMEKNHLYKRGSNLRPWLLTILRNLFINGYRRRRSQGVPVSFQEHYHGTSGPDPLFAHRATHNQIEAAIGNLPAEQREVVVLIPMQGFSYDEAAEITEVPVGTIRSRLSRARQTLKKVLDGEPEMPAKAPQQHAA